MRSDDGRQRPRWLIWTIVGGAAALVTIAGVGVILAMSHRGSPEAASPGSSMSAVSAIDKLRSHLPAQLKSAQECVALSPPISYAAATITCTWNHSNVPHTATYSLFDNDENMLKSAKTRVRDSGYGPSCRAAGDFSTDGGKMTWQHENRDRGTIWCYVNDNGEPVILWTDTTPNILTSAIAAGKQNAEPLLNWFLTVGQASLEPAPAGPQPQSTPTTKAPGQPASPKPPSPSKPSPPPGGGGSPMRPPPPRDPVPQGS